MGILVLAIAAALLYYVAATARAWLRLRSFPGPPLAGLSYAWIARADWSGRGWKYWRDASARYGPLVRVGPNELITDDVELLRRMSGARSRYTRSQWYALNRLDPYEDSMFSHRDTATHDRLKAQTAAAYSGKENPALEMEIDDVMGQVKALIRRKYLSQGRTLKPLDLGSLCQHFTLDSITRIAFGEEFGFVREDGDVHNYMKIVEDIAPFMQVAADVPILASIMSSPIVLKLAGPSTKDKMGIGKLMGVAQAVVGKRFQPDAPDQRDMLGAFIRHGLTRRQCETEALFQVMAGSDTTATAIRTTMLYIMTTPHIYTKLLQEISNAIRDGKASKPITSAEAENLPYIQAIVFEGLRIHPPFAGLAMKQVPPEGDTFNGKFIPGGTRIAASIWSLTHSKAIFGADAELFRPERWIEADEATRNEMRRATEMVFGYGRWGCAGKSIAFMELNKIFFELWREFDFQLVYPTKPMEVVNHNLFLQKEMWVKVTERDAI
ncbi:uncharacterized protein E0L32_000411 [Thyridium curvatum]|uniref:Cytochrome P450 monooxygenase ABA1 n=1 Tax=Thyridium curvatum TaxID=1093900 RepID=A0A507B2P9_9PEZI|nr:uncharacterized protein E0L32_000411 [Thyridium curvatum]TPX14017.1 hypothetical protein E0L32_000411 [Thyridium curvatum]